MHRLHGLLALDWNLLPILFAILKERHITRAAARLEISQPTASRALATLRAFFQDDLMMRSSNGYTLTPVGEQILLLLQDMIPLMQATVASVSFDPCTSRRTFRISTTEYISSLFIPHIAMAIRDYKIRIFIHPYSLGTFKAVESCSIDLMMHDDKIPHNLSSLKFMRIDMKCLINESENIQSDKLSLCEYTKRMHVISAAPDNMTTFIDRSLESHGAKRMCKLYVPYTTVAARAASSANCIITVPAPQAAMLAQVTGMRVVDPPDEIGKIDLSLVWNPHYDSDPGHAWMRNLIAQVFSETLPAQDSSDDTENPHCTATPSGKTVARSTGRQPAPPRT